MFWRDLGCARSVGRIFGYYMLSNLIQILLLCLDDIDSICVSCLDRKICCCAFSTVLELCYFVHVLFFSFLFA